MKYRNILFDLYGTLIDIRTDEEGPRCWEKTADYYTGHGAPYTAAKLRETYHLLVGQEKTKAADPRYPEIDLRDVFAELYRRQGVHAQEDLLRESAGVFRLYSLRRFGLYPGVRELLEHLKEENCRLFLLSNAQSCFTKRELALCGLETFFEKVFLSSDYRCCKPSAEFFAVPFESCGLKKEETVMIGNDAYADIHGARAFGIDSIYIHQAISPPLKKHPETQYCILDGDVRKIISCLRESGEKP